jgi:hypothetical protein
VFAVPCCLCVCYCGDVWVLLAVGRLSVGGASIQGVQKGQDDLNPTPAANNKEQTTIKTFYY